MDASFILGTEQYKEDILGQFFRCCSSRHFPLEIFKIYPRLEAHIHCNIHRQMETKPADLLPNQTSDQFSSISLISGTSCDAESTENSVG